MKETKQFTTVEQMETDMKKLKEIADSLNVDTFEGRAASQQPQCKFGSDGVCCTICGMGPCRITPKAPYGICGADEHAIAGRNFLRMAAAGSAAHSDHAREILHVLHETSPEGPYQIKDEAKLIRLAAEWGVKTEGRDIYEVAHEVAEIGLLEFGKPFGTLRNLNRATKERQEVWEKQGIAPRAIDREISTALHMSTIGNTTDPLELVRQAMRVGMADGWGGSMLGTDFTDIIFGTPQARGTSGNLGVLEEDQVNIIVHGHNPCFSEMIVLAADSKEMQDYAKSKGAQGINISGICCTANEVTMRHGVKIVGGFLQQEHAILTGAVEMMCVDVQCVFPSIARIKDCFHTKFVTSSPICRIPGSVYVELSGEDTETAYKKAIELVKDAIDNYQNRDQSKVWIPENKQDAVVGYSTEQIISSLDGVTNSFVASDPTGTYKPALDAIRAGVIRGAVAMVGCNNPKARMDHNHTEIMKGLLANDILIVGSGCASQAAIKSGFMDFDAKEICGEGMKRVCNLVGIPPILHMGACVDISRMMLLVTDMASEWGVNTTDLPVVGCAAEWMSEKAVAIANYVISTGLDVFLGINPPIMGSSKMLEITTEGMRDISGAGFTYNTDPHELVRLMVETIEAKRKALGI
ncbi:MAG: anaerobic carbon-monoxide dehydrogenase catalytic subunit [Clostridiales bacterium]|nr:anaerobic carbon-monoxide dehydrogenase catalytic subunit [Clostridiales bacterium]